MKKKIVAMFLAFSMTMSMVACGETAETTEATETTEDAGAAEVTDEAAPAAEAVTVENPSTDFSDGLFGFVGSDKVVNPNADTSVFSVSEFDGQPALLVEAQGAAPYVAIQMDAMVGDKIADVDSVAITIGSKNEGGFYATSGNIYSVIGGEKAESTGWSIYLEDGNPKTYVHKMASAPAEGDYIVVSMENDVAVSDQGLGQSELYILDITFLDADGNTIEADTSAEFVEPSTGVDRSNLCGIAGAVEFEGFTTSAGGWAQEGFDMPQEIIDALVPGSVVEISYASSTGNIWLVMPDSAAGWMRVGVGDADGSGQQYAYVNGSKNIAQITYEQLAAVLGDDVSTWGARMQCESDGDWEVYSIKVGTVAPNYVVANAVEFADFTAKADAWAQDGKDMPQEIIDALVPGSIVEISYASESGDMWIVMPDSAAGWMRVGVGNADGSGSADAISDGSKAYITYEMIADVCGDDVSTWGARMQCESDSAWEVYGIKVGTANEFVPTNVQVDLGITTSAGAWAQDGGDLSEDAIAALVPGSVININYASETDNMWIVMPDSAAGWMRVGVGDADGSGQGYAVCDGTTCQIPYEMIAEYCGDDVSAWGARLQCESDGAWEVYSVSVGQVE